jgi:hypothetical protein
VSTPKEVARTAKMYGDLMAQGANPAIIEKAWRNLLLTVDGMDERRLAAQARSQEFAEKAGTAAGKQMKAEALLNEAKEILTKVTWKQPRPENPFQYPYCVYCGNENAHVFGCKLGLLNDAIAAYGKDPAP